MISARSRSLLSAVVAPAKMVVNVTTALISMPARQRADSAGFIPSRSNTDTRLPPELEREIFEIVALQDPRTGYQLTLVAKRVNIWITPLLYKVLMKFSTTSPQRASVSPSLRYWSQRPKTARLQETCLQAEHLLLNHVDVTEAAEIIGLCRNVRNLALWLLAGDYHPLVEIVRNHHIERLSINLKLLFTREDVADTFAFDVASLNHLSHLDMIAVDDALWATEAEKLCLLPRLTHLAVYGSHAGRLIDTVLAKSKTLKLLISFMPESSGSPYKTDPRLVHIKMPDQAIDDWESGARGGDDFWVEGERMQTQKIASLRAAG